MKIDLPPDQSEARPANWKQVADITGEAFVDDPVNRWAFGNPRAVKSVMRIMAREVYLKQGRCFLHGDKGASMWAEPGVEPGFPPLAMAHFIAGMIRYGGKNASARGRRLGELMAEHHPGDPHMYLFTIATTKAARGQGVGKALLAPVLAACDQRRTPVYLENTNPENHGFYRAHGFETLTKFEVGGPGSPVIEPMWREPA